MSLQRMSTLAILEFKAITRLPIFWILIVVLGLLTFSLTPAVFVPSSRPGSADLSVFINSKYALIQFFAFSSLLGYPFFVSILAGMSVIRDEELNVGPIIHSTPLSAGEYIVGKYLGVWLALLLPVLAHLFFAILRYEVLFAGAPNLEAGPFSLANYLFAVLVFTIPGILLYTAITFALGVITRKTTLVYAVPVVLFVTTMNFALSSPSDGLGATPSVVLLDPSGLHWILNTLFLVDRGIAFYNNAAFEWEVLFAANRIFLCLFSVIALWGAKIYFRRSYRQRASMQKRRWFQRKDAQLAVRSAPSPSVGMPLRALNMEVGKPTIWVGTMQIMWAELRAMCRQPVYYLFLLFTAGMVSETVMESSSSILGTFSYLTAGSIAVSSLEMLSFLICLVLLFYIVDALHRDHVTGAASIVYATQVRTAALLMARVCASVVLFSLVIIVTTVMSLLMLASQGSGFVKVQPFVIIWGGLMGATFLLWTTFILAVDTVVRSRYTTYAVGLMVLGLSAYMHAQGKMTWMTNWDLWGVLRWSEMGMFDLNKEALLVNRLWVVALALFFFAFAVTRFERTVSDVVNRGVLLSLKRQTWRWGGVALMALGPMALLGYTAHRVAEGFQGETADAEVKAYWRQNVATWRDFQPAAIHFMDIDVALQPAQRRFEIQGAYLMVNTSSLPTHVMPFTMGVSFKDVTWEAEGEAIDFENRAGLHLLRLRESLSPGDSLSLRFTYHATYPHGFTKNGGGVSQFVLPAGVSLSSMRGEFLPVPGFIERRGIFEENYYQPANQTPELVHLAARPQIENWSDFQSRITVTVPTGYRATATGALTSSVSENGQTTDVWETAYPVRVVNLMAGKWDLRQEGTNEIYYYPSHTHNLDALMEALVAARTHYSEWFYPYPWRSLKISEFPNMEMNATAYPTNIAFSESIGFLTRPERDAHLPFVVTAHEVAHQWWGHLLRPAEGPGADVLIEGMANFATLLLVESEKGDAARKEYLKFLERQYVRSRREDAEQPLVANVAIDRASESVAYNKTPWVMWMLQQHLGREQMLAGMRSFMAAYVPATKTLPNLQDLVHHLRIEAVDSTAFDTFAEMWMDQVVLPEFRILDASLEKRDTGWQISAVVINTGSGSVWVELAALSGVENAGNEQRSKSILLNLPPGLPQSIEMEVDFEPERLAFDPDVFVLQRSRENNTVTLSAQ